MRDHPIRNAAAAVVAVLVFSATAEAAQSPTGIWIDHTGRGAVEIKDCGSGNLCGHVVWTKDNKDAKGCGYQILGNVQPTGRGQWDKGWIYSPERKKKFSVELTPLDGNRLRVKGYKGIKLFSKTMIWHRASSDLERCDSTTTTVATPNSATPKATQTGPSVIARTPDIAVPAKPSNEPQSNDGQQDRNQTAAVTPQAPDNGSSLQDQSGADDRTVSNEASDGEGLASLLEGFNLKEGFEVGDGYGLKVEENASGEKNCLLKVPYVTVNIPCED